MNSHCAIKLIHYSVKQSRVQLPGKSPETNSISFQLKQFSLPTEAIVYIIKLVWNWLSPLTWSGAIPGWQMCVAAVGLDSCLRALFVFGQWVPPWRLGGTLPAKQASPPARWAQAWSSGDSGKADRKQAGLGSSPKNLWKSSVSHSMIKWDAAEMGEGSEAVLAALQLGDRCPY